jgi:hypothetical protein
MATRIRICHLKKALRLVQEGKFLKDIKIIPTKLPLKTIFGIRIKSNLK